MKTTIDEIRNAMTSNTTPLLLTEIANIVLAKNEKDLIKKLKKICKEI